jgi:uncharacterized protein (DUF169 family)
MRKLPRKTVSPLIYVDSARYFQGGRMRGPFCSIQSFCSADDPIVKERAR